MKVSCIMMHKPTDAKGRVKHCLAFSPHGRHVVLHRCTRAMLRARGAPSSGGQTIDDIRTFVFLKISQLSVSVIKEWTVLQCKH